MGEQWLEAMTVVDDAEAYARDSVPTPDSVVFFPQATTRGQWHPEVATFAFGGKFDTLNASGVKVRYHYACTLRKVEAFRWVRESLMIEPQGLD